MASKSKTSLKSKTISSVTPKSSKVEKKSQAKCGICSSVIIDSSDVDVGEDSIFCEGTCQVWLHRTCAGLTVPKFNEISKSDQKFLCVHCRLDGQSEIIKDIKANLSDIHIKLDELLSSMSVLRSASTNFWFWRNQFYL